MSNLLRLVAYLLLTNTMLFSVMSRAVIPEQKVLDIDSLNQKTGSVGIFFDHSLSVTSQLIELESSHP